MCYKMRLAEALISSEIGIHQAPNGLGNPRETNTFVIRNRAGKWSIATVQMGNNFAHTLRDKSQLEMAEFCGFREVQLLNQT